MKGVPDADHCPADADEVAERYVMESLPDADAMTFEQHLLTCSTCRATVEEAGVYVRAMRTAAAQLRNGG
jgi:anti-sigma factor RsiW